MAEKKRVRINMDETALVQLNQCGLDRHREWHRQFEPMIDYRKPETDVMGYSSFVLWELMQIFGCMMFNGGPVPFWDNVIEVELDE